jgi:hypothetical protein
MVKAFDSLAEATTAKALENLVSVGEVVVHNKIVIASLVIEAVVVLGFAAVSLYLLDLSRADVVNMLKRQNLDPLVARQQLTKVAGGLAPGYRKLDSLADAGTGLLRVRVRKQRRALRQLALALVFTTLALASTLQARSSGSLLCKLNLHFQLLLQRLKLRRWLFFLLLLWGLGCRLLLGRRTFDP